MALVKGTKTATIPLALNTFVSPNWLSTGVSHSQNVGADGLLLVIVAYQSGATINSVTYNSVAMSKFGTYSGSAQISVDVYSLTNPSTGANNIIVSGSSQITVGCLVQSFTGAQALDNVAFSALANTPHSQTFTILSNSMIMVFSQSIYSFDTAAAISIDGTATGFSSCDINGQVYTSQFCAHTRDARLTSGSKTVITDTQDNSWQATNGRIEIKEAVSILVPTVSTTAISAITFNTASSGGNVTSDGGASVTARGVCWSTSANPTIALSTKTSDGTGTGSFTSSITGLAPNTLYYVRAYATNSVGTAYGNEVTFTTYPIYYLIT